MCEALKHCPKIRGRCVDLEVEGRKAKGLQNLGPAQDMLMAALRITSALIHGFLA